MSSNTHPRSAKKLAESRATLVSAVRVVHVGHAGRGVAFLLSGAFLIYTGLFVEGAEAARVGNTVNTIERPGAWMFFAVAAGLTAYRALAFRCMVSATDRNLVMARRRMCWQTGCSSKERIQTM